MSVLEKILYEKQTVQTKADHLSTQLRHSKYFINISPGIGLFLWFGWRCCGLRAKLASWFLPSEAALLERLLGTLSNFFESNHHSCGPDPKQSWSTTKFLLDERTVLLYKTNQWLQIGMSHRKALRKKEYSEMKLSIKTFTNVSFWLIFSIKMPAQEIAKGCKR